MAVWEEVLAGRKAAHAKHGANSIESVHPTDPRWLPILVEEMGEIANALTYDGPIDNLRAELLDLMAVASAAVDSIDGRSLTDQVYATSEEEEFVDQALRAVDSGSAGHWPTVAGYLADEIRRLRGQPKPRRHECGCDGTPHWYPDDCPPRGLRHA